MVETRILIVEDEVEMAGVLQDNLEYEGYQVEVVYDGCKAMDRFFSVRPDLVVLDIMLPGRDGTQLCLELRKRGIDVPILFLTARGSEVDRVVGLEIGGDDYLTKPFFMKEFLARVKALLRRARSTPTGNLVKIGDRSVDLDRCEISDGRGRRWPLSHYEIEILKLLLQEKNRPVPRNRILDCIWGIEAYPTNRTVDNYIVKLRKKLEEDHPNPRHILTVHGVGYKLVP